MDPLPAFRYHPDPVATGSVKASDEVCEVCRLARGFVFTGTFYSAEEVSFLCPWCIADGSAAFKFSGDFVSTVGDAENPVPLSVSDEVSLRTPGFSGWQDERWLAHCGDACAYLGMPTARELAEHPDAMEAIRSEYRLYGWDEALISEHLQSVDPDGQPTAYLFRCRHCGAHRAYTDFT